MKFSKFLQAQQSIPIFRGQWVTYRSLKKLIKAIVKVENSSSLDPEVYASELWWFDSTQKTSLGSIPSERIQFIRLVECEINKTSQFYKSRRTYIIDMLAEIHQRIEGGFALDLLVNDIDTISSELLLLERFIYQAKQLLLKITKKHDKRTSYKVSTWMLIRLEKEDFWNPKISDLVIAISDVYAAVRDMQAKEPKTQEEEERQRVLEAARENKATQDFVRKNEKYFIRPEDVLLVKLAIIKHLPLDIFGREKQKNKRKYIPAIESLADLQDSSVINSIYLDNSQKSMYHERTGLETPKGNLIRVRWYGSHANPPKECYMERKTRLRQGDDLFAIDEAVKERFLIKERNIQNYMSGEWTIGKKVENLKKKNMISAKDATELTRKANSIQSEITGKGLHPVLRTVVRRSAFQTGADQTLRVSLDTNLHIINEVVSKESGQWARDLTKPLRLAEVKTLPFAILEVKTQAPAPQWMKDLIASGHLFPAANFSKFLYGTCKLSPSHVRFTPAWWSKVLELERHPPMPPPLAGLTQSIPLIRTASMPPPPIITSAANISLAVPISPEDPDTPDLPRQPTLFLPVSIVSHPPPPSPSALSAPVPHPFDPPKPRHPPPPTELVVFDKGKPQQDAVADLSVEHSKYTILDNNWRERGRRMSLLDNIKASVVSVLGLEESPYTKLGPGSGGGGGKAGKRKAQEQRIAKVFFANERTLLSWLNTATFLSLTGITLISTESHVGRATGFLLSLCTVAFAGYALAKYWQRLKGLQSPAAAPVTTMGDKLGPLVLIVAFCFALLISSFYFLFDD